MSGAEAPPQRRKRLIVALRQVLPGGERLTSTQLLSRFKNDLAYSGSSLCTSRHLGDLARHCAADLQRSLIYTGKSRCEMIWMRVAGDNGKEYLDSREPPSVVSTGMDAKPDGSKRLCSSPISPQHLDLASMLYLLVRPKFPPERRSAAINCSAPAYIPDEDSSHTSYMAFQTDVKKFLFLSFLDADDVKSFRCVSKSVSPPLTQLRFHSSIRVTKFECERVPIGADSVALAAVRAAFVALAEVHGGCSASLQRGLSPLQSKLSGMLRANKVCGCMAQGKRPGGRGSSACRCAEAGGWGSSLVGEVVDEEEMEEEEEESEYRMAYLASAASRQPCSSATGGDEGVRERPRLFLSPPPPPPSSGAAASSSSSTLVARPQVRRFDLSIKFNSPRHFSSTNLSTLSLSALQSEVGTLRRDLQLARAGLKRLSLPLLHPATLSSETTAFEVLMMQYNLKNKLMLVRSTVATSTKERLKLRSRITDVSLEFLSQAPSNRSFTKLRDNFKLPLNCLRLLQKKIKDLEIGIAVILELPIRVLFIQMVLDLVSGEAFMARAGLVFAVEGDMLDSLLLDLWDALGEYVNESPQLAKVLREMESVPISSSSVPPQSVAGGGGGAVEEGGSGGGAVAAEWGIEEEDDLATAKILLDFSAAPLTEDCGEEPALDLVVRIFSPPKIELKMVAKRFNCQFHPKYQCIPRCALVTVH